MAGPFAASPQTAPGLAGGAAFAPRPAAVPRPAAAPQPAPAPAARPLPGPAAARVQASASAQPVQASAGAQPVQATAAARPSSAAQALGLSDTQIDQIIDRTSKYEGTYTSLNRNTDRAGLSFGFIQFAQKPGSLGQVLTEMSKKDPAKFNQIFGPDAQQMLRVVTSPPNHGVDASGRAADPRFDLTQEPWLSRFEAAGKDPGFQGVQRDVARKSYFEPAMEIAREHGIRSPEGLSMLFDTAVQQGRNGARRITASAARRRTPGMSEREYLEEVARTASRAAGPRWQKNVLKRRMGILNDESIASIGRAKPAAQG
jgi:hypothetical protein